MGAPNRPFSLRKSSSLYPRDTSTPNGVQYSQIPPPAANAYLTLSFAVLGGGSAYSPPTLSYVSNGTLRTVQLNSSPTTYSLDPGSTWTVSGTLGGSKQEKRWATNQSTTGVASANETIDLFYYRQFLNQFNYEVVGGGSGYSAPSFTYYQFTTQLSAPAGSSVWADASTPFAYDSLLQGSSSSQRWMSNSSSGTVSSAGPISRTFYHQFNVSFGYAVIGGGSDYSPPDISYTQFGSVFSTGLGSVWADAGSSYSYPIQIGGSSSERWQTGKPNGTIASAASITVAYYHQYFVAATIMTFGGGNPGDSKLSGTFLGGPFSQNVSSTSPGAWFDSGTIYTFDDLLSGSTSAERWAADAPPSANVSSMASISALFYHQYAVLASYTLVGGGTPAAGPNLNFTYFGGNASRSLSQTAGPIWVDSGSPYALSQLLRESSQMERWRTDSPTFGTISASTTLSPKYYHQFFIVLSFSMVGGGTATNPIFSFYLFGAGNSTGLGSQSLGIWADQGPYGVTSVLGGSTSTERWAAVPPSGMIDTPGTLTIVYEHQFYLSVVGPTSTAGWYDGDSTATITVAGVYGRNQSRGFRSASYSVDGGPPAFFTPTTGPVDASVLMDAPHELVFNSVMQYAVQLDSDTTKALGAITSPTIMGDNYWYDSGTAVTVTLNGAWGRTSGTGFRLVGYYLNGGIRSPVVSSGTVTVISLSPISSAQSVRSAIAVQHLLITQSGMVGAITPATIPGDGGWYDSGTTVNIVYNYVWNTTVDESRANAVAYTIDGAGKQVLPREGGGTFRITTTMDERHSIDVVSVVQYHLSVYGGNNVGLSSGSPTGDNFYDSGSIVTARTDYTWSITDGQSRQNLVSFTLDGRTTDVPRADFSTFSSPTIAFNTYHDLILNAMTQYFISFSFTDNSGSKRITPTSLQINVSGAGIVNVTDFHLWLDGGSKFEVTSVRWEGTEVKPTTFGFYGAVQPLALTIHTRTYEATIRVSDYLGLPVSTATATIELVNGTTLSSRTGSDGTIILADIPLGRFNATVSNFNVKTSVVGDASMHGETQVRVALSAPLLGVVGAAIVAVAGAWLALRRRRLDSQLHAA